MDRQSNLLQTAALIHQGQMTLEPAALEMSVAIAFALEKIICERLAGEGVGDRSN